MKQYLTLSEASELIGKSKETLRRWDKEGKLSAVREPMSNYRVYNKEQVETLFADFLIQNNTAETISNYVEPHNEYSVLELFAGAGGLAKHDLGKTCAQTLARQPGPRGRRECARRRGVECDSCGAKLHL